MGKEFQCVDQGFNENELVEIVIRPEDLEITTPENGQLQVRVDIQSIPWSAL